MVMEKLNRIRARPFLSKLILVSFHCLEEVSTEEQKQIQLRPHSILPDSVPHDC